MKKTISNLISVAIFAGGILVLKFYFDAPYLAIIGILAIGFLGGMAFNILVGYSRPSRRLFRFRFFLYGVGTGIILVLLSLIMEFEEDHIPAFNELILKSAIAISLGILIFTSMLHSGLKKLRKGIGLKKSDPVICDYATYISPKGEKIKGCLILTGESLIFYTRKTLERLFTLKLKDLEPGIRRAKITGVPNGISLQENEHSVLVAFPYFWKEMITKQIPNT